MSWMHLNTISLWQRCRNINTHGKISANNSYNPVTGQIVPAELNMHDSVHFDDAMERHVHNEITGFYDPICTPIKLCHQEVQKDIKTRQVIELDDIFLVLLTLSQQWQLGLTPIHLWAVCSPMHAHGWAWPSVFSNPTNTCFQILRFIWDGIRWSYHPHSKCTAALVQYIVAIWSYHHREYRITPELPECVFVCQGWQENEKVRFNNCWNLKTTSTCCPTSCRYSLSLKFVD